MSAGLLSNLDLQDSPAAHVNCLPALLNRPAQSAPSQPTEGSSGEATDEGEREDNPESTLLKMTALLLQSNM